MLQGDDAASLARLVTLAGGSVSHRLHVINAVGAHMTRSQLDAVLATGEVERHIDDLALSPPEEPPPACIVGGALELEQDGDALLWHLFNKGVEPAHLDHIHLSWPAALGDLRRITFDGELLPSDLEAAIPGDPVQITTPDGHAHTLDERAELRLHFSELKAASAWRQSDFTLRANFGDECVTELIPGYHQYGTDTYYPSVTGADELHKLGVTGKGVTVAVLDSGLWEHPNLKHDTLARTRIVGRYDAISDTAGNTVFDESGHGTHMTSILAHSAPVLSAGEHTGSYMGMAPDVNLVAVKAFNKAGQGDFLDIVRAVQWIVDNRERLNIRVLNLSFAARPRWPYWQDPINQAILRAWQAGITVIAAAGNEGPEPMTIGSPGNLPYIITVGAVTDSWTVSDRNDDYIPDFSSRGPTPSAHIKPDIVAPGGHIAGITRPGSTLTQEHPDYMLRSGEFVMTGTSQAAALVSGAVALLLQLQPDLKPDDVKCKLTSSAEPAINRDGKLAYSPFVQGSGYLSVTRAVTLGETGCGNTEMDILLDLSGQEHYQGPAIMQEDGSTSLPGLENILSNEESEKGPSDNRRWGVKAHIERLDDAEASQPLLDWRGQYDAERTRIEQLSR